MVYCTRSSLSDATETTPNSLRIIAKFSAWHFQVREIGKAETRKQNGRSHAHIFECLTLTRHPYYLRAWNRLAFNVMSSITQEWIPQSTAHASPASDLTFEKVWLFQLLSRTACWLAKSRQQLLASTVLLPTKNSLWQLLYYLLFFQAVAHDQLQRLFYSERYHF